MFTRPIFDIRQGLRATLERLEQTSDSVEDAQAMDELKRILLNRIAELDAIEQAPVETATSR